jgi:ferredoxin
MKAEALYLRIAETIDRNPLGAPKSGGAFSPAFLAYLQLLYSPAEARVVQHLQMPSEFMSAARAAKLAGGDEAEVKAVLEGLVRRGAIMAINGSYALPQIPLLLNSHQFRAELKPEDLEAARLYQQFFIEEGFYKFYESSAQGTPIMRAIPVRRTLEPSQKILDTEEAHRVIEAVKEIAMVPCPCRTRTEKMGTRECRDKYPIGSCLMTGVSALYFELAGLGRKVTADQARRYLDQMQDLGLAAITDNYNDPNHSVICLCCSCCCSQVRGRTRWENPLAVSPSNFVPVAGPDCAACGTCVDRCFFGALAIDEETDRSIVDPELCIGCGVCTLACPEGALKLHRYERSQPFATPRDLYRTVARENQGPAGKGQP